MSRQFSSLRRRPSARPTRAVAGLGALAALVAITGSAGSETREPGVQRAPDLLTRHIGVGGITRSYLLHVPGTRRPNERAPLVLVFHGGGSRAAAMQHFTRFDALADTDTASS
jgi:poly(3-hydroxybutyrate) depolymerase